MRFSFFKSTIALAAAAVLFGIPGYSQSDQDELNKLKAREKALYDLYEITYDNGEGARSATLREIIWDNGAEASFDYDFPLLGRHFNCVKSDDGRLRLYEYVSNGSAHLTSLAAIQYRMDDGYVKLMDSDYEYHGDSRGYTSEITHFKDSVYIVESGVRHGFEQCTFTWTPLIIHKWRAEETNGGISYLRTEYLTYGDLLYDMEHATFDKEKDEAIVPQMSEDEWQTWTGRYVRYKWDGSRFVEQPGSFTKNVHESVSEFKSLMVCFATKGYTVRVDRMNDGSIRYASWKRGARQDSIPDIILHGGKYDEDLGVCRFDNGAHTYLVYFGKDDLALEVRRNGKTILKQDR